jgi:hypothetical protein
MATRSGNGPGTGSLLTAQGKDTGDVGKRIVPMGGGADCGRAGKLSQTANGATLKQ